MVRMKTVPAAPGLHNLSTLRRSDSLKEIRLQLVPLAQASRQLGVAIATQVVTELTFRAGECDSLSLNYCSYIFQTKPSLMNVCSMPESILYAKRVLLQLRRSPDSRHEQLSFITSVYSFGMYIFHL